jgi:hypothetical protein
MINLITRFAKIAAYMLRRGHGIFKWLFVIDDFIRLFTMTMFFPLVFSFIGLKGGFITFGVILGLIIDAHDLLTDFGVGRTETIG